MPNQSDAEEILQETNLVLWRKFEEFPADSDFRAWAFQVAFNKVNRSTSGTAGTNCASGRRSPIAWRPLAASAADSLPAELEALDACKKQLSQHDRDLIERRYQPGRPPPQWRPRWAAASRPSTKPWCGFAAPCTSAFNGLSAGGTGGAEITLSPARNRTP